MATPFQIEQRGSGTTVLSGVDRIAHFPDVSVLPAQSVPLVVPVSPGVFPRLSKLASAFQRIRYEQLQFVVEPQISTAVSGGYVAAFIKDVADLPAGSGALNQLTAQAGSKTTKWWESVTINVGSLPDLYYTSDSLSERRWSSPGIFAIGVDGKCTQPSTPLTVYCRYRVRLSEPSLEDSGDLGVKPMVEVPASLRMERGQWRLRNAQGVTQCDKLIPGSKPGAVYRMPSLATYLSSETASPYVKLRTFGWLKVNSDKTVVPCHEDQTAFSEGVASDETLVLRAGDALVYVAGESLKASAYLCVNQTYGPLTQ